MTSQGPRRSLLMLRHVPTPIGELLLVASERGLLAVSLNPKKTLEALHGRTDIVVSSAESTSASYVYESILDEAESQLEDYFEGNRKSFALTLDLLPWLPISGAEPTASGELIRNPFVSAKAPFFTAVQMALLQIPFGQTRTYSEVALSVEHPRATRAVGSACARNPLAIVVPCHRVTRTDGGLGNYAGGVKAKKLLLDLEAQGA